MRVSLSPALILHRRPWRESSLLVEAFAREQGRVGLIAKGARRATARWRGLLEPLAAVDLSWSGRGELYTLTGAEGVRRHPLADNALMAGLYASELVMRLTARDDPHPKLYDSLLALLDTLFPGAPAVIALRFFERDLLATTGYGVPLEATSDGSPVSARAHYYYDAQKGLRVAAGSAAAGEVEIGGRTLLGLAQGRLVQRGDVREARALMRAAIAPLLGGAPLKSVQTLQAMQQFTAKSRT
jgi:DNA repair protein RecO (recombination protein O)